jgi:hypothetical protein
MDILDTINLELKKYAPIFLCIKGYCFDILLNVNHSPSESGTIRNVYNNAILDYNTPRNLNNIF